MYTQLYISTSIYPHVHVYICTHIYTHMYIRVYIHTFTRTHTQTQSHTYIYIYVYIYTHTYIYIYIYTYIYTYIYIYIHTYTYTNTCIYVYVNISQEPFRNHYGPPYTHFVILYVPIPDTLHTPVKQITTIYTTNHHTPCANTYHVHFQTLYTFLNMHVSHTCFTYVSMCLKHRF